MIRQLILNVGANRNRHCDSSLKYNQDNQWWVQIANVFIISCDGGMASLLHCLLGLQVYTCMGLIRRYRRLRRAQFISRAGKFRK